MEEMTKITNKISKKKLYAILLGAAVIGVLLILIGTKSSGKKAEKTEFESLDPTKYAKEVEERVEALCNRVDGAGSAYAVVTLKGGYRAVYASDSQSGANSYKSETVVIGGSSNARGLLIGYENPEISGIGIVCSGGDDRTVRNNIISVVSSAFGISTGKIYVSGS